MLENYCDFAKRYYSALKYYSHGFVGTWFVAVVVAAVVGIVVGVLFVGLVGFAIAEMIFDFVGLVAGGVADFERMNFVDFDIAGFVGSVAGNFDTVDFAEMIYFVDFGIARLDVGVDMVDFVGMTAKIDFVDTVVGCTIVAFAMAVVGVTVDTYSVCTVGFHSETIVAALATV